MHFFLLPFPLRLGNVEVVLSDVALILKCSVQGGKKTNKKNPKTRYSLHST